MVELVAPLLFVVLAFILVGGRTLSSRSGGNALDAIGDGKPGLLLTAVACAQILTLLNLPTFGSAIGFMLMSIVGFIWLHSAATAVLGGFVGTIAVIEVAGAGPLWGAMSNGHGITHIASIGAKGRMRVVQSGRPPAVVWSESPSKKFRSSRVDVKKGLDTGVNAARKCRRRASTYVPLDSGLRTCVHSPGSHIGSLSGA